MKQYFLKQLNKKKQQKVIVKGIGKVATVPIYLLYSGAIFKRNLKWREGTSLSFICLSAPMHVLMHFLQRYSVHFQF